MRPLIAATLIFDSARELEAGSIIVGSIANGRCLESVLDMSNSNDEAAA